MSDAKLVRVRKAGSGDPFVTLPGNTADISIEGNNLEDTIFGQRWESGETGLIDWGVSANALYRGFAGYNSTIRKSGTPTAFTDEAMSVEDGLNYVIDDDTKTPWDWTAGVIVEDDNEVVDDEDIESIDYLFGRVTFVDGYTVDGDITVSGEYLPLSDFGQAMSFDLTQTADTTETTSFEIAQENGGFRTFRATLRNADLDMTSFYRADNSFFSDLEERDDFIIEITPDPEGLTAMRGIYKTLSVDHSGDVGGDEESTVSFVLSVPEDVEPLSWYFDDDSTIPAGLKVLIDAFLNRDNIEVQYLPEGDGNRGFQGEAVVTDTSLSSGVDDMVEASVELQGTDTLEEINVST